jgi:acyl-CoA synthetase (AMP-forming)/AMP-acid ligase II
MNLAELLTIPAQIAQQQPIVSGESFALSYTALESAAASLASDLRARRGVEVGDRVALLDTTSATSIALLYACAATGAVFVPLNYRARVPELAHMLAATTPGLLFVGTAYLDLAVAAVAEADLAVDVVDVGMLCDGTASNAATLEVVDVEDETLAALIFTSGTTARAKAVMLAHADLINYATAVAEVADGDDRGSILVAVPMHHIAGLSALTTAIWTGRRVVPMRQFDPGEWLRLVETERITHAFLVPTMLKRVLDHGALATVDLSSLEVLSYGAAPMPMRTIRRAIDAFPSTVQFVNAFGQTETASTVTTLLPADHRLSGDPVDDEKRLRRLASIGRPVADVAIQIVDERGDPQLPGQVGEIVISTNRLMRGYFGQPEATAATLRDGWLHTRDLGWMDEDGYIFLTGRTSDMIIRGGENIAPEEVEIVLESHARVEEAAAFGRTDEEWGEVVIAAVVSREASSELESELVDYCRERLGTYKTPQQIVFVDALPRTELGKLRRGELRDRFAPAVSSRG